MPKPISWEKNAPEIRRAVAGKQDSHFHRKDLQNLFTLMPRAASALMEAMPRVRYGTAYIVGREQLLEFLDDVIRASDVPALIEARRAENLYVSRRKPRMMVLKEKLGNGLASLPDYVTLTRGELRIKFETSFELMEAQMIVISNMRADWYEFSRLYEPEMPVLPSESAYEAIRLGREAMRCLAMGHAARAGDFARQATHHAHWVQVERATITIEEYDKEMEILEGVAGAVKLLRDRLSAEDGPVRFGDLVAAPGASDAATPAAAPKREPMPAATDYAWTRAHA